MLGVLNYFFKEKHNILYAKCTLDIIFFINIYYNQ